MANKHFSLSGKFFLKINSHILKEAGKNNRLETISFLIEIRARASIIRVTIFAWPQSASEPGKIALLMREGTVTLRKMNLAQSTWRVISFP